MSNRAGFTLIELLITIIIIGILAAIAYPTYQASANRSRRADGMAALVKLALDQERFRSSCPQYATTLTGARTCNTGSGTYRLGANATSDEGYYNLSIQSADATGFELRATATGVQTGDSDCRTLILDQDNNKGALDSGGNPSQCW